MMNVITKYHYWFGNLLMRVLTITYNWLLLINCGCYVNSLWPHQLIDYWTMNTKCTRGVHNGWYEIESKKVTFNALKWSVICNGWCEIDSEEVTFNALKWSGVCNGWCEINSKKVTFNAIKQTSMGISFKHLLWKLHRWLDSIPFDTICFFAN